jgi:hypothetical protein
LYLLLLLPLHVPEPDCVATLIASNKTGLRVAIQLSEGLDAIEEMLRQQLIAAIGKEVGPVDFTNYMVYHNRKMFRPQYVPVPFAYAVRLPDHYPEGTQESE